MHQGCGLQRVSRSFIRHPRGSQLSQLLIDQRQQFLGGFEVAMLNSLDYPRDIAHARRIATKQVKLPACNACLNKPGLSLETFAAALWSRDQMDHQSFTRAPSRSQAILPISSSAIFISCSRE